MSGIKRLKRWMLPTTLVLKALLSSWVRRVGSWPRREKGSWWDQVGIRPALAMR
jgi:hypothetical protein